MSPRLRSPITWLGGKRYTAHHILPLLPPHLHYVEPFGGGASVLLAKPACKGTETYNDIDGGLVNFFKVLADPEAFCQFYRRVILLPLSRQLYAECRATWAEQEDPVERAVRWFVTAGQSFTGWFAVSWKHCVNKVTGGTAQAWDSALRRLPLVHARLSRVQIEYADFRTILSRYQGPGYLAYCDPPYVHRTRSGIRYACELTDADHAELVQLLLGYDGAVVLSGYRNEIYEPLEAAGWERREFDVPCYSFGITRAIVAKRGGRRVKPRRIECVWRNPECLRRIAEGVPE